jgi:hypothetical protein
MEDHQELPEFQDAEPLDLWKEDVKRNPTLHFASEVPPRPRSEYLQWSWKLTTTGGPDQHLNASLILEAILTTKAS